MPIGTVLASVFGGKAKEIASTVIGGLDNLFTSKEEKLQKQLEIEQAVNSHLEKMEQLAVEQAKAELEAQVKEMESARNMNTKIQESDNASWLAKNIAYCLDVLFVITFVIMLYLILNHQVPESNKELFYTGFGLLGGYVGTILNFHRGTSMGSEKKQKQLDKMINRG